MYKEAIWLVVREVLCILTKMLTEKILDVLQWLSQ